MDSKQQSDTRLLSFKQRTQVNSAISRIFLALQCIIKSLFVKEGETRDRSMNVEFSSAIREISITRFPICDNKCVENWIIRFEGIRKLAVVPSPLLDSAIAQLKVAHGLLCDHASASESMDPMVVMAQQASYGAHHELLVLKIRDDSKQLETASNLLK
jgi:hypothetical protein